MITIMIYNVYMYTAGTITPSSVPHAQEPHTPTILESSRFSYNVKKPTTTSGQPLQPPPTLPPSSKLQSSSSLAPVKPVKPGNVVYYVLLSITLSLSPFLFNTTMQLLVLALGLVLLIEKRMKIQTQIHSMNTRLMKKQVIT